MAVTGSDDVPLAGLTHPGLTTATHPIEAIAAAAAGYALEAEGSRTPGVRLFPSQAVLRHSA